jgi:hypothetical protein
MKRLVFTCLSTAAVCALLSATPALAAGADPHGVQNQTEIHPNQANQPAVWAPNGVAEGEVYPASQAYGRGATESAAPSDAADVIMQLGDAYAEFPAPYGADNVNVPGRLSVAAARARCHVVHVQECLRASTP